jgi:hypothetical protein
MFSFPLIAMGSSARWFATTNARSFWKICPPLMWSACPWVKTTYLSTINPDLFARDVEEGVAWRRGAGSRAG